MNRFTRYIAAAAAYALLAACAGKEAPRPWYSEIRSADKLVLATMTVSKLATVSDPSWAEARGFRESAEAVMSSLKVGDRVAAYSYDTYLRAYIDLSELSPDDVRADDEARTVTIELPPVNVETAGRDPELREVHYRVTGLRSAIDARERARLKEAANTHLKAELEADDTLTRMLAGQAREKARRYFEALVARDGYTAIVRFKD